VCEHYPGQVEAFLLRAGGLMGSPVTVLAVDDQPTNLRLLDAVLTPRGHRVITASSGAEALALLETEDVDLVLLDIVMPEMDGHEVCRRIRSTAATEFPAGRDDHGQRERTASGRPRVGRRRLRHQAIRPKRAARRESRRWRGSSDTTTPSDDRPTS